MPLGVVRLVLFVWLAAACATASVIDFTTTFGPEVAGATGSGSGFFSFDTEAQTLFIQVNWAGLSGPTTVAHIHCCTAEPQTGFVGIAVTQPTLLGFPAGVTAGDYETTLDLTLDSVFAAAFLTNNGGTAASASAALLQGILDGRAYFNIHTSVFPGGEIRGFLQPVPEPATFALSGLALLGLVVMRRRSKRVH